MSKKLNFAKANAVLKARFSEKEWVDANRERKRIECLKRPDDGTRELIEKAIKASNGTGEAYRFSLSVQRWAFLKGHVTPKQRYRLSMIAGPL